MKVLTFFDRMLFVQPLRRGGRRGQGKQPKQRPDTLSKMLTARIEQYLRGEWNALWLNTIRREKRERGPPGDKIAHRAKRVESFIAVGELGRASEAVTVIS